MQIGILKPVPLLATYLSFRLKDGISKSTGITALRQLFAMADGSRIVLGLSLSLCKKLGIKFPKELHDFQMPAGSKIKVTEQNNVDLLVWIRATDKQNRGDLIQKSQHLQLLLADSFVVADVVESFKYEVKHSAESFDLTGYEDGTENPKGQKAKSFGFAPDGSSYLALQKWLHQWDKINSTLVADMNKTIGRNKKTNAELETAPQSAHVKRSTQEDFTLTDGTQGFSLRRSLPWSDGKNSGLMFAAFGKSFESFELQFKRMVGADDDITDALFNISKPLYTNFFWCPPVVAGKITI
ncbi:MAG TPA: Dyp-type peroxidase [Burkholderiaceae bacterium]|nr:Dyp-type peroxidase [Burkholderiaceae bacterium]